MPRFHRRPEFQAGANVPMMTMSRDRLALEIRMAGESLAALPTIDAYNTLSKMLASLPRAGLRPDLLAPGTVLMNSICDRYEQSGAITVECEEAAGLRQVVANIDAALHRIPLQRFNRAVAEVEAFFAVADPSTNQ
ncbi:hypothetical protein [Massilia sp.]|uniref:hypothetical protein n=1 Tax=Massilia sp. TaxID=1882437 RepID=UPI0028A1FC53|nr:hypothetical protein [Massilia sp.]